MPREQLLGLAADVDRLLAAGATAAAGHDGLSRRSRTLRELGQKVAALLPVADAVERVTSSSSREAGRAFLDLMVMARQLRGSLAAVGVEGTLQSIEASGPWQTPTPTRDVYIAHEVLAHNIVPAHYERLELPVAGDLRLIPSALASLEGYYDLADKIADDVLPIVGRGVLPDLLAQLDLKGNVADARRLRAVCKIDPKIGAELVRKALREGNSTLKFQALECLPDVGEPGEAEKVGLEMWKETNIETRVRALHALRKATGNEALEVLIQALLEGHRYVGAAREVLAELPHPRATERLLREMEQRVAALPPAVPKPKKGAKTAVVKAAADAEQARGKAIQKLCRVIETLGGRKDSKNQRVLRSLLDLTHRAEDDANFAMAAAAVEALNRFPPKLREAALPTLLERAADPDSNEDVVHGIARMLSEHMPRFGDKILALLHSLLRSKIYSVRGAALHALVEIGPAARKLLPEILESVKKGENETDFEEVLIDIEPEGTTAIPALIEMLGERNVCVRASALNGLTAYGPKARAAEPHVAKLLKDRKVKFMAEVALAAIKGEK
ncbi:MAG TPA: hypothetical protein VH575_12130 [Gemmataceae bacterium]|jgi:hypothetical protein